MTYDNSINTRDMSHVKTFSERHKHDFINARNKIGIPYYFNKIDGTILSKIPAGKSLAGEDYYGKDLFSVTLPAYYLALHPVTNEQYALFLNNIKPNSTLLNEWLRLGQNDSYIYRVGKCYKVQKLKTEHPVVSVSWFGAAAYCFWAGLRLPTELEWEKGARGVDGRAYPWGNEWDSKKCRNSKDKGPLAAANIIELNTEDNTTCGVWEYPEGCSPWGMFQMAGNIWEWCSDWYDPHAYEHYRNGDLSPPTGDLCRVQHGGSYDDTHEGCFLNRTVHVNPPNAKIWRWGFRCALTYRNQDLSIF